MFRSDLPTSYTGRNGVARDLLKPVAGAPLDACAQGVLEAVAELPAHGAVHDEVDGAVKQSDGVDEVAERHVDVAEAHQKEATAGSLKGKGAFGLSPPCQFFFFEKILYYSSVKLLECNLRFDCEARWRRPVRPITSSGKSDFAERLAHFLSPRYLRRPPSNL